MYKKARGLIGLNVKPKKEHLLAVHLPLGHIGKKLEWFPTCFHIVFLKFQHIHPSLKIIGK